MQSSFGISSPQVHQSNEVSVFKPTFYNSAVVPSSGQYTFNRAFSFEPTIISQRAGTYNGAVDIRPTFINTGVSTNTLNSCLRVIQPDNATTTAALYIGQVGDVRGTYIKSDVNGGLSWTVASDSGGTGFMTFNMTTQHNLIQTVTSTSNLYIPAGSGATNSGVTAGNIQGLGTWFRLLLGANTSVTAQLTNGIIGASTLVGASSFTIGVGTSSLCANLAVRPMTAVTLGTTSSFLLNTATLYVESSSASPIVTGSGGNNYAVWVDGGSNRFDGDVQIGLEWSSSNALVVTGSYTQTNTSQSAAYIAPTITGRSGSFTNDIMPALFLNPTFNAGPGATNPRYCGLYIDSPTGASGFWSAMITKGSIVPFTDNTYNNGANGFRWNTVFTSNVNRLAAISYASSNTTTLTFTNASGLGSTMYSHGHQVWGETNTGTGDVGYMAQFKGDMYANGLVLAATQVPSASYVVNGVTGSTAYKYVIVAKLANGGYAASNEITVPNGNATLAGSNTITLSWTVCTGSYQYAVYRTLGSAGTPSTGSIFVRSIGQTTLTDNGQLGNGTTPPTGNSTGNLGVGVTAPTAYLHIKGGATGSNCSPLKFTSGALQTTPTSGSMEYDGTNLYFVRSGSVRESIISANSVNSISPTSPNRTITVVIDGNTYYLAAKTTND